MDMFGSWRKLVKVVFPTNTGAKNVELSAANQSTGSATITVQIPDVGDTSGTLVEIDASQVLTNKTLTAPVINGSVTGTISLPANSVNTTQLADNSVSDGKLRDSAGFSVVGKATTGTGDPADILISSDRVLGRTGSGNVAGIQVADAQIASAAAIDATKLANGQVSNTEFQYLDGVTSPLQAQLDGKQPLDADLTAVAGLATAGLIARTGAGTAAARTITGTTNLISVVDGDGVAGNPTLSVGQNVVVQGGNTLASALRVGTNDANSTIIEANNSDRITARVATSADADVKLHGTAGTELPAGTAAQRPSAAVEGTIRFNTDSDEFEGYANGAWSSVGGGVNEAPRRNYLKTYALASVAPGTLSTLASSTANLVSLTAFYADATSGSAALTLSSSSALVGASNYLSALSGADVAGGRFFQLPAFAIDAAYAGKPVNISFDITGLTALGWDVVVVRYNAAGTHQEIISVAGTASAATVTPSASLKTGTDTQRGFFVANSDATMLYAVRFRRLSGVEQIRIDTLFAGPQAQLNNSATTDWQSYTPTTQGFGTISGVDAYWRQVGDTIYVRGVLTAGTTTAVEARIGLPNGAIQATETSPKPQGRVYRNVATANARKQYTAISTSAQDYMRVGSDDYTSATSPVGALNGNAVLNTTEQLAFEFQARIANASSNITMAERAVEEYAWNSGTWDSDNTSSFGNGASGFAMGGSLSALRTKRVRFQTPIQATDSLEIEVSEDQRAWVPLNDGLVNNLFVVKTVDSAGDLASGVAYSRVSGTTTDLDVFFGRYARMANDDAPVTNWPSTNAFWRVRKVSGGAAVGFPVGARNVVGDTSGASVPVAFLGELMENTRTSALSVSGTTEATVCTFDLSAGVWLLHGQVNAQNSAATNNANPRVRISVGGAAESPGVNSIRFSHMGNGEQNGQSVLIYIVVSATSTANLNLIPNLSAGSYLTTGKLTAVRVA